MKIVNQRGEVYSSEQARKKLGKLVSHIAQFSSIGTGSSRGASAASAEKLREEIRAQVRGMGLDENSKEGLAAAGAALIANAISAGLQQYEQKAGQPVPKHVLVSLQSKIAEFAENFQSLREAGKADVPSSPEPKTPEKTTEGETPA